MRPIIMALLAVLVSSGTAETLSDVLDGLPGDLAARRITSYSVWADEGGQVFAGYFADELDGAALGPLHVISVSRGESPRHAVFTVEQVERLGSVTGLQKHDGWWLVGLHLTPSASTTLVLDQELVLSDAVEGWVVATVQGGRFLFQGSMAHFAPTHSVELLLYDAHDRTTVQVYPPGELTPIMRTVTAGYAKAYQELGDSWCARRNHHCDPSKLDSSLGPVSTKDGYIGFIIAYDPSPLRTDAKLQARIAYLYAIATQRLIEVGPIDGEQALQSLLEAAAGDSAESFFE